ncbi:MAG: hypothetical protein ABH810_03340 [bacterium]
MKLWFNNYLGCKIKPFPTTRRARLFFFARNLTGRQAMGRKTVQKHLITENEYDDRCTTPLWGNSHAHFRGICCWKGVPTDVRKQQEALMRLVVPIQCADPFGMAVAMPNLKVPVTLVGEAFCYRQQIHNLLPERSGFEVLVSVQLHLGTTPEMIQEACRTEGTTLTGKPRPRVRLAKLYPAEVTNSPIGVSEDQLLCEQMMLNYEEMARQGMILSVHPEVFCGEGEYFACEEAFIPTLEKLSRRVPKLLISVEHISTKELLEAVLSLPDNVVGTFTVHHLIGDTVDFWDGTNVCNHFNFCRSVLREEADRLALLGAIADPIACQKLSLGLDDAPHTKRAKENGAPGIWIPGPIAASLLLETCEAHEIPFQAVIDVACLNGPRFYGLEVPERTVTFERCEMVIPEEIPIPGINDVLIPWRAGKPYHWRLVESA